MMKPKTKGWKRGKGTVVITVGLDRGMPERMTGLAARLGMRDRWGRPNRTAIARQAIREWLARYECEPATTNDCGVGVDGS